MERFSLDSASAEYKRRREELRQAEIALKDRREAVAALRRALPADTPVPEDYAFAEAAAGGERTVRLSELFAPGGGALIVDHFMWAPGADSPCPMCAMWADGYDAVLPQLARAVPMVLAAKKSAAALRAFADRRGWTALRVLSSGGSTFNADFGMEDAGGAQLPGLSVFLKKDSRVFHFYTSSAIMGDGHYRGLDLYSPVWNLLDLLPDGRGDVMPRIDGGAAAA